MKKISILSLAGLAALIFAGQAFATPCPTAPAGPQLQTQGSPVCIAPYGSDGAGTGLVNILAPYNASTNPSGIFSSGPSVNPYTSQVQSPYWSIGGTGVASANVLLELSAYAGNDTFGIFDPTNPSNQLVLFSPSFSGSGAGSKVALSDTLNGNGTTTYDAFALNGPNAGSSNTAIFGGNNLFGFFLIAGSNTFYSLPSLNEAGGTTYPNGTPHMVAYQGNNQDVIKSTGGLWLANEYIMAWEDLPFSRSDLDYQDFIVMVESVHPVPEPAVLGIFGLGILMIGMFVGLRRRDNR